MKAYHDILWNDICVLTHRLHKKDLDWQDSEVNLKVVMSKWQTEFDTTLPRLYTLKPFCSANFTMVDLLSLVVFVASKTWKSMTNTLLIQLECTAHILILWSFNMKNWGTAARTHRHLSSFDTEVLPNIIECRQCTLTVKRLQTQSQ